MAIFHNNFLPKKIISLTTLRAGLGYIAKSRRSFALVCIAIMITLSSFVAVLLPNADVWADSASDCAAGKGTYVGGGPNGTSCDLITKNSTNPTGGLDWEIQSWWYYNAISQCFKSDDLTFSSRNGGTVADGASGDETGSLADAKSGNWFSEADTAPASYYMKGLLTDVGDDGQVNCNEGSGEIVAGALNLWKIDGLTLLCGAGIVVRNAEGEDCATGKNDDVVLPVYTDRAGTTEITGSDTSNGYAINATSKIVTEFQNYIQRYVYGGGKVPGGNPSNLEAAAQYFLYDSVMQKSPCIGTTAYDSLAAAQKANGNDVVTLEIAEYKANADPTKQGTMVKQWYKLNPLDNGVNHGGIWTATNPNLAYTCKTLAAKISDPTDPIVVAYAKWVYVNKGTGGQINCKSDSDATGCTPPTPAASTCNVPSIGWIVCPVFNLLASISDGTYGVIQGFLQTSPSIFDTSSGTYTGWQIARNLANVGFVIVFLIIIFSQISSIGISNYGVKKMLPRLIIAAVLVNASYFVCEIAVDLSNILGSSIYGILTGIPLFSSGSDFWAGSSPLSTVTGELLAGTTTIAVAGVATGLAIYTGIGLLVPVLLGAVLAILVTFFILIARQAIVVLAVVVAPLAFLAMLLPNTESMFKQWRKVLVSMLLLYPMIALLFGGARIASSILMTALASQGLLAQIAAAAVGVLPLLATPVLLKGSLNAIPALGNLATKLQNRANGFAGNKAKELYKSSDFARGRVDRKALRDNKRTANYAKRVGADEKSIGKLMAGGIPLPGKINKYSRDALSRNALLAADDADTKDVQAEKAQMIVKRLTIKDLQTQLKDAVLKGEAGSVKARAAQSILLTSGEAGKVAHDSILKEIDRHYNDSSNEQEKSNIQESYDSLRRNLKFNHSDIKASDAVADKFMNAESGTSYGDAVAQMGPAVTLPTGETINGGLAALNPTQLVSQPISYIKDAGLTGPQAAAILENDAAKSIMSPEKKTYLQGLVGPK